MHFLFHIDEQNTEPLYKQICDSIKTAILEGRLKQGDKLPSSRTLSDTLGVSRVTASRSLDELASQGYIKLSAGSRATVTWHQKPDSENSKKYFASADPTTFLSDCSTPNDELIPPRLSGYAKRLLHRVSLEADSMAVFSELNFGASLLDELPVHRWRDMVYGSARLKDSDITPYVGEPLGYPPLRKVLSEYLGRVRMLECSPDQIAIASGAEAGLDLIIRLILEPGDLVGVEDPCSPLLRTTFLTHGARLMPIRVDEEGIVVDQLLDCDEVPRLLYLTPSRHDPTGVALSTSRRRQLLSWARKNGTFIIEDDFDNEYIYGQRPVPPLWTMDEGNVVIYRYNFWRALYPLVRCGFMVLPPQLVPIVSRAKAIAEREVSYLEQRALTQMIGEGHLDRHIRRTKGMYAKRRAALYQAITRDLKKYATISQMSTGMHLIVHFKSQFKEAQLIKNAAEIQVPMVSTSSYYFDEPRVNEFMFSFAHHDEESISRTIHRLAERLEQIERSASSDVLEPDFASIAAAAFNSSNNAFGSPVAPPQHI
jgi:GntR family transcriptional regulator / MocR family aminotransferase